MNKTPCFFDNNLRITFKQDITSIIYISKERPTYILFDSNNLIFPFRITIENFFICETFDFDKASVLQSFLPMYSFAQFFCFVFVCSSNELQSFTIIIYFTFLVSINILTIGKCCTVWGHCHRSNKTNINFFMLRSTLAHPLICHIFTMFLTICQKLLCRVHLHNKSTYWVFPIIHRKPW